MIIEYYMRLRYSNWHIHLFCRLQSERTFNAIMAMNDIIWPPILQNFL